MTRIASALLAFLWMDGGNAMLKPKVHFEQVPLETVRKLMVRQLEQEKAGVLPETDGKKKLQENTEEPSR